MFAPIIPSGGVPGWLFLQRTYDTQLALFSKSGRVVRDADYFSEKIGSIETARDLVADRRLLEVTLGAFGLQDDLENRFFIQKILQEGTTSDDTLANRLADPRYADLSNAFGFGPGEVRKNDLPGFAEGLIARYQANAFEVATGGQDDTMRIGLYAQRVLAELATEPGSNNTKWFNIMGQPPLRDLFEKALGLPSSFGQIDIDQQLSVFKDRASAIFGSADISQFADADKRDAVITRYMARAQMEAANNQSSPAAIALTLLGGGR
jgi:hypothetical protein